jgi:hypothetical protein
MEIQLPVPRIATPEDLHFISEVYQEWYATNKAPSLSERLFNDDLEKAAVVSDDLRAKARTAYEAGCVSCAQRYLGAKKSFEERDVQAPKLIDEVVDSSELFSGLNKTLEALGTDYKSLCIEEKRLLTPAQLDRVVFRNWIAFPEEFVDYHDCQSISILGEEEGLEGISAYTFFDTTQGKTIQNDKIRKRQSQISGEINFVQVQLLTTIDQATEIIRKNHENAGHKSYCIINPKDMNIVPYLGGSYNISRMGKVLMATSGFEMDPI